MINSAAVRAVTAACVLGSAFLFVSAAPAAAETSPSCSALWMARNKIFARHGYCFHSDRAREAFGGSCFPPYGRMTKHEKRLVRALRGWEDEKGC